MFDIIKKAFKGEDPTIKLIEERGKELQPLRDRWEDELDIYLLEEFELTYLSGPNSGKAIPGMESITSSMPRTFADHVKAKLCEADLLPVCEGALLTETQKSLVEKWWRCVIYQADRMFYNRARVDIKGVLVNQSCLRGWLGARGYVFEHETGVRFDILPFDMPNVTWEDGPDGLIWGAYKIEKTKMQILQEYDHEINGKKAEVIDFWTPTENIIYIDGKKHDERENLAGRVPMVILPIDLLPFMVGSETDISMVGPSLFTGCADDWDTINRIESYFLTLVAQGARPPLQFQTHDLEAAPKEYPHEAGSVSPILTDERYDKIPQPEIMQHASYLYQMRDAALQRATLPYNEYGGLNFELSALAIEELEGQRHQIFSPRIRVITKCYAEIALMLFDQFVVGLEKGKFSNEMTDSDGQVVEFDVGELKDLRDKFRLSFRMTPVSPEKDIANFTKAAAARQAGFPFTKVWSDVMEIEDVEGMSRAYDQEVVETIVPELKLVKSLETLEKVIEDSTDPIEKAGAQMRHRLIETKLQQLTQPQQEPVMEGAMKSAQGAPQGMSRLGGDGKKSPVQGEEKLINERLRREGVRQP